MDATFQRNGCKLTLLSVALAHTLTAAASTLNCTHDAIHVRSTAPLLVGENINTQLLLARLDQAHVGEHTLILEGARQLSGDGGVGVQAGQGDQLQNETEKSVSQAGYSI